MHKRNSADLTVKKIPIRLSRNTQPNSTPPLIQLTHRHLTVKYLNISVNAFNFRKTQNTLKIRYINRQLTHLASQKQCLNKYYSFEETKAKIKNVVMERVEKDYIFGLTFHQQRKVLEQYVKIQKKVKQRNLFNNYYFSNCPPKISIITQPTITTLFTIKGPETNSTIELKALTHNIDLMLTKKSSSKNAQTPDKRSKHEKSEKMKRKNRAHEDIFEQTYGLKNFKKGKGKNKIRNSVSRGSLTKLNCITPQPHAYDNIQQLSPSPLPLYPRLSDRKTHKSKSSRKRNSITPYKKGH